jgi:hypothetical protein
MCELVSEGLRGIVRVLYVVLAEAERTVLWSQSNSSVKYDLLLKKHLNMEDIIQRSKTR